MTLKEVEQDSKVKSLRSAISLVLKVSKNPKGTVPNNLAVLQEALISFFNVDAIDHWVYREENGRMVPYFISGVKYKPSGGTDDPAYTEVRLTAITCGELNKTQVTWSGESVGKTPPGRNAGTGESVS